MSAFDTNQATFLAESLGLPSIFSFDDLVKELRLNPKLVYWLSKEDALGRYHTFFIDKKNGKKRQIDEPVYSLKIVQRWILINILYKIRVSKYSYGFAKTDTKVKSPLVQVANEHKNNLYLLNLDLKDFYPSINRDRVYNFYRNIGYNKSVSNLLTNLCICNNSLPQGAVTSAYLANLICRKLDNRISGYCNKKNIVFTRYADDLAFSSNDRELLRHAYSVFKVIIKDEGFTLNSDKTRFNGPIAHKKVLGVTINDGLIKAPKSMKRLVRQRIHKQIATGNYDDINVIRGYIAYINSIEPGYKNKIKKYVTHLIETDLSYFPDLVEAYNKNKIYSDFPEMKSLNVSDNHNSLNIIEDMIRIQKTHDEFINRVK